MLDLLACNDSLVLKKRLLCTNILQPEPTAGNARHTFISQLYINLIIQKI